MDVASRKLLLRAILNINMVEMGRGIITRSGKKASELRPTAKATADRKKSAVWLKMACQG